jgi:hypothetical protein
LLWLLIARSELRTEWKHDDSKPTMPTVFVHTRTEVATATAVDARWAVMSSSGVGGSSSATFHQTRDLLFASSVANEESGGKESSAKRRWREKAKMLQWTDPQTTTWSPPTDWSAKCPTSKDHRPVSIASWPGEACGNADLSEVLVSFGQHTRHLSMEGIGRNGPPSPYYMPQASTSSDPLERDSTRAVRNSGCP